MPDPVRDDAPAHFTNSHPDGAPKAGHGRLGLALSLEAARDDEGRDAYEASDAFPGDEVRPVRLGGAWAWGATAAFGAALLLAIVVFLKPADAGAAGFVLAAGIAALAALFAASTLFAPEMGAPVRAMFSRRGAQAPKRPAKLAQADVLSALGIAEQVLDADDEPRLITRRDGAVIYANKAYLALAEAAGVSGASGLPPRIDRLFAQSGADASKVFRLCRAAKGAEAATEIVHQLMGLDGAPRLRRFAIDVRPLAADEDHVVWRLREREIDEADDAIAKAYAAYPRPVFAMDRGGRIVWSNAAFAEALGAERSLNGAPLSDILLGESDPTIRTLWAADGTPCKAKARRKSGDPLAATYVAFARGGVGDGVVVVDMAPDEAALEPEPEIEAKLTGDLAEAPFGVAIVQGEMGRDARIVETNRTFADVFAVKRKDAPLGKHFEAAVVAELAAQQKRKAGAKTPLRPVEATVDTPDGKRIFHIYLRAERRRRGGYGTRRAYLFTVDATDLKRAQEETAQDMKLKAIGQLAGGVAHDFNNMLQVVLGNCEILLRRHAAGDPSYPDLVQMQQNAQRAANLTAKLLAFSRKQTLRAEVVSVTEVLREFAPFLNRSITEKVKLDIVHGRGLPRVRADKNQLEIAMMNLAVNARDAMAEGGVLTIRTERVPAEAVADLGISGLAETDHLLIEVSDTGAGVPQEIADKVFEPYFTTKETGKGTGLGLSTVHGVVHQMGGRIRLASGEGQGAVFRIYLPAAEESAEEAAAPARAPAAPAATPATSADLTGAGRILVVEDEDAVRAFVVRALEMCGYIVTAAADGEDAAELIEASEDGFDVVLSDIMMPDVDGPTLIFRMREKLGAARVIFMSGYAEEAMRDRLDGLDEVAYIQKPFTLKAIAAKIKELLPA